MLKNPCTAIALTLCLGIGPAQAGAAPAPATPVAEKHPLDAKKNEALASEQLSAATVRAATPLEAHAGFLKIQTAAKAGDRDAQYALARRYLTGSGVEGFRIAKDSSEAGRWLRKAAEGGHAEAQYVLGLTLARHSAWLSPRRVIEAESWLRSAHVKGHTEAGQSLANMELEGKVRAAHVYVWLRPGSVVAMIFVAAFLYRRR